MTFHPNPFWHALTTHHAHLSLSTALARRYPAAVLPFAALAEPTPQALDQLSSLFTPGEEVWVQYPPSPTPHFQQIAEVPCLQLHWPPTLTPPPPAQAPQSLTNPAEMVTLTGIAFPGFFRPRTPILGAYFGFRDPQGTLIAMGGERIALPGSREISALCTHPAHRGQGYAATLLLTLLHHHRAQGLHSFLHVSASNAGAIALYQRLGFVSTGQLTFRQLRRLP